MAVVLAAAARISVADAVAHLPLSVDFEGGYAVSPDEVRANVAELIATGAIGLSECRTAFPFLLSPRFHPRQIA